MLYLVLKVSVNTVVAMFTVNVLWEVGSLAYSDGFPIFQKTLQLPGETHQQILH
jgi:hypothetical protein